MFHVLCSGEISAKARGWDSAVHVVVCQVGERGALQEELRNSRKMIDKHMKAQVTEGQAADEQVTERDVIEGLNHGYSIMAKAFALLDQHVFMVCDPEVPTPVALETLLGVAEVMEVGGGLFAGSAKMNQRSLALRMLQFKDT